MTRKPFSAWPYSILVSCTFCSGFLVWGPVRPDPTLNRLCPFENQLETVGAAVGWPLRLDREAAFCAKLDRHGRGTCHTALIIFGLVLAWISVALGAYQSIDIYRHHPHVLSLLFDGSNRLFTYIFQLSTLPCPPTTGGKGGDLYRFSSSHPDQPSHRRYLFTLGCSPRTIVSLEVLRMSLWTMWVQERAERQRKHRSP